MMLRSVMAVMLVVIVVGCRTERKTTSAYELTENPRVLLDEKVATAVTLHGLRLGDAELKIPASRVEQRTPAGWVVFDDGTRVRVVEGRVVALGFWDANRLERLGVKTREDIATTFGSPAGVEQTKYAADAIYIHRYPDRQIDVLWDEGQGKVIAVNVVER